jgi:copper(I)-binding protein
MKLLNILILSVLTASFLFACQSQGGEIEAHEVWSRPAVNGGNGAVYMVIHNHTRRPDQLIGAESAVAQTVELHKSEVNDQGVMVMLKQDAIDLPADGEIIMQPGGYHIMLLGLKQDLKVGDTFEVVLKFRSHPDLRLQVTVKEGGGMDMQHGGGEHDQGDESHNHPMSSPTP